MIVLGFKADLAVINRVRPLPKSRLSFPCRRKPILLEVCKQIPVYPGTTNQSIGDVVSQPKIAIEEGVEADLAALLNIGMIHER